MTTFVESINSRGFNIRIITDDYSTNYCPDPKKQLDGMVRVNASGLEYYMENTHSWVPVSGSNVNIEESSVLQTVINWALIKMEEERKINELVDKYPALRRAKVNYETVKALVQNE